MKANDSAVSTSSSVGGEGLTAPDLEATTAALVDAVKFSSSIWFHP